MTDREKAAFCAGVVVADEQFAHQLVAKFNLDLAMVRNMAGEARDLLAENYGDVDLAKLRVKTDTWANRWGYLRYRCRQWFKG